MVSRLRQQISQVGHEPFRLSGAVPTMVSQTFSVDTITREITYKDVEDLLCRIQVSRPSTLCNGELF